MTFHANPYMNKAISLFNYIFYCRDTHLAAMPFGVTCDKPGVTCLNRQLIIAFPLSSQADSLWRLSYRVQFPSSPFKG